MRAYVIAIEREEYLTMPLSELIDALDRANSASGRTVGSNASLASAPANVLSWGLMKLDPVGRHAFVGEDEVPLTRLEFDILHLLMANRGRTFTRRELLDCVCGYEYEGYDRAVDGHVMNLRRKMGFECIETVRGVGYRFTASG
ncbi:winged helix-turn-helix domain-containing protein [Eggerthella timonensis]|uniref:winged helix-turn-helix domain-containing protein n=1 Tax=Eggerthella timonensis TaxID=1871008 RepID=UPI001C60E658|nr:winged helix-turn-helix domain-containing protein [Eggerthella timonensis]